MLLLLFWNVFSFLVYGLDKGKARKGIYRISEKKLLLITYFFGGVGAYIGAYFFHHKTRKWYFQIAFIAGVILDLALFYIIWSWR
ncbi:DUF1294 domain-containing protein [Streptococcus sp. X16XC17]|uniref:DUF1294 domain-containing protein n=2 Tax=unclassified Streptococcus TaxID=2608887 RepID=UPI001F106AC1|nr:DUF1294 domain-containing protein [Streptococcus sp. X16XC17]